ncbi:MAG: hypothetical protein AB1758_30780 [Candidatus Eremiobacterota bacterium]
MNIQALDPSSIPQPVPQTWGPAPAVAGLELVPPPDPLAAERVSGYIRSIEAGLTHLRELPVSEVTSSSPGGGDLTLTLPTNATVHTNHRVLAKARELARKISFVVKTDGKLEAADGTLSEKVAHRLAALTEADLEQLEKGGVRVLLVTDRKQKPRGGWPGRDPGWDWPDNVGAYYNYGSNDVVIPIEYLDHPFGGGDALLHELGHALSDVKVPDEKRILGGREINSKDREVGGMLGAYRKRCGWQPPKKEGEWGTIANPAAVWSQYALEAEAEYLAEGVRCYTSNGDARRRLAALDPDMFNYVKGFLGSKAEGGSWWGWWNDENPRG